MLTMDTGKKSSKGHGGHQENIQLPETKGSLRLGFPAKHLTHQDRVSRASASFPLPGKNQGERKQKMLTRVERRLLRGEGQRFLLSLGTLFPEIQALSFHIGPGHSCGTQEIVVRLQ